MKRKVLTILLLSSIPFAASSKVFMCEEGDKTTFSQTPCMGKTQEVEVVENYTADSNGPTVAQISEQEYLAEKKIKREWEQKVFLAIRHSKIIKGMVAKEVISSWGQPNNINSSTGSYGTHEQYVYSRGNAERQYVYLENGFVTGWGNN